MKRKILTVIGVVCSIVFVSGIFTKSVTIIVISSAVSAICLVGIMIFGDSDMES